MDTRLALWWALPVFFMAGSCAAPSASLQSSGDPNAVKAPAGRAARGEVAVAGGGKSTGTPVLVADATRGGGGGGGPRDPSEMVSQEPPPAGDTPPSSGQRATGTTQEHFAPVNSRWYTLGNPPDDLPPIPGLPQVLGDPYEINEPYDPLNPYRHSWIKGDFPIPGTEDLFFQLTATDHARIEQRRVPTPTGITGPGSVQPQFFGDSKQTFFRNDLALTFELFKGQQGFKPVDWKIRVTPVLDYTRLEVEETGVTKIDVTEGTIRRTNDLALQEALLEYHLFNLDDRYDFISSEIGILPFRSDFRGFIFDDTQLGVRLFGNADENKWQYNLVFFDMLDKDTNSDLNKFEDREQEVLIANVYRQDWPVLGYTTSFSFHFNNDHRGQEFDDNGFLVSPAPVGLAEEHKVRAYYLGWTGEGHLGRINITHALYQAFGRDNDNPFAAQSVEINAQLLAAELSYDIDWLRIRGYGMYASGDRDTQDGSAQGFDAIVDGANFGGGQFSYFNNQAIKLGGVNLTNPGSFLPDLQTSKFQGQSNFVNPGLQLIGTAFDFDITPTIKEQIGVNYLRFDNTSSIETFLEIPDVERSIGFEFFSGTQFRPFLTNNLIFLLGLSALLPGAGLERIYQSDETLYQLFLDMTLTF